MVLPLHESRRLLQLVLLVLLLLLLLLPLPDGREALEERQDGEAAQDRGDIATDIFLFNFSKKKKKSEVFLAFFSLSLLSSPLSLSLSLLLPFFLQRRALEGAFSCFFSLQELRKNQCCFLQ